MSLDDASDTAVIRRVGAIWRYPVKSMQGEWLEEVRLDAAGIPGDRRLALRDLTTGKLVSAKVPKLGIPLLTCGATTTATGEVLVTVGGRQLPADAADDALSELLGRPVRIEPAVGAEEVYESEWPTVEGLVLSGLTLDLPTAPTSFADVAPLHLLATTSVAHLAALAPESAVTTQRFRPGIVIETARGAADGFVENDWRGREARLGDATITFGAATPRCMMVTLPQGDLPRDPGVLQTLAQHNRMDYAGFGDFACLGIYAEVSHPGTIRVGDPLTLL